MAGELGKIEKPASDKFKGSRKLYVIPLLFAGEDTPDDFKEKTARYWLQVGEHILAQESKVGKVARIYHEAVHFGGAEGLKVLEQWKTDSYRIVKQKTDEGAVMEATELADLSDECMDWERCLMLGFYSRKVADMVSTKYRESSQKRYKYISGVIDESLQKGEVGLLFIREGHAVQFPPDTDVFTIAPPALDDIHRWLRERTQHQHDEGCGCGDSDDCGCGDDGHEHDCDCDECK